MCIHTCWKCDPITKSTLLFNLLFTSFFSPISAAFEVIKSIVMRKKEEEYKHTRKKNQNNFQSFDVHQHRSSMEIKIAGKEKSIMLRTYRNFLQSVHPMSYTIYKYTYTQVVTANTIWLLDGKVYTAKIDEIAMSRQKKTRRKLSKKGNWKIFSFKRLYLIFF